MHQVKRKVIEVFNTGLHENLPAVCAGFIPMPSRKEREKKQKDQTDILQFTTLNLQLKKYTNKI